jgi:hypothetical protein
VHTEPRCRYRCAGKWYPLPASQASQAPIAGNGYPIPPQR